MKLFPAIGVPLDGSEIALRSLGCATWLASRLGGRVHVLHAGPPLPRDEALARLRVPEKYRELVELHQAPGHAADEILAFEARHRLDLMVMTARGESETATGDDPLKMVGHVTREVIEKSRAPVLVLPRGYQEALPWRSALVPVSGEPGTDASLTLALRLAQALDLTVTVAHVAAGREQEAKSRVGVSSDEPYHEYPSLLNEFVSRACPMCSAAERGRIEDFRLYHGDIAAELRGLIEEKRISLLVVGWHGRFMAGHAPVLKALIQRITCPVLLVKAVPREPFRLKIGRALAGVGDEGA